MDSEKKYIKYTLCAIAAIAAGIIIFFIIYRFTYIRGYMSKIGSILSPIVYGAVIAYLLTPLCNFFERHIIKAFKNKTQKVKTFAFYISILLSLIIASFIVYEFIMLILPEVGSSIIKIYNALPSQYQKVYSAIETFLANNPDAETYILAAIDAAYENLSDIFKTRVIPNVTLIITGLSFGVINVIAFLKNILLGIVASVYILGNRRKFSAQIKKIIYSILPLHASNLFIEKCTSSNKICINFLSGKILDSFIIGVLCFIGCSIMSMPYTMLISLVVGVTNIIPFFGPFIGAIPCSLILLLESPIHCLYFVIFILILQQFDGNILGPKILGNSVGTSGFWIFTSILFFGGIWGFAGMVVGVPVFAVIYNLVSDSVNYLLKKKKLSCKTSNYYNLKNIDEQSKEYITQNTDNSSQNSN